MARRDLGANALTVLSAVGRGYRYGFDVMEATDLASGAVYRALARLMELGLVTSKWEAAALALKEKRPRRRYYEITDAGKTELEEARERLRAFARLAFGRGLPAKN